MTKTLVFKRHRTAVDLFKGNYIFLIITAIFIFGLLLGSFSISICQNQNYYGLNSYFSDYIVFLKEAAFSEVFLTSFFMFSLIVFLNYILGLCLIGNFISLFISIFISFGIGSISGFLYKSFSVRGIGFFALALLPGLFLFCINYILSLKRSFCFSKELFKLCKSENQVLINFKNYSVQFIIHFILCLISSLVYSFFSNTFVEMFNFN